MYDVRTFKMGSFLCSDIINREKRKEMYVHLWGKQSLLDMFYVDYGKAGVNSNDEYIRMVFTLKDYSTSIFIDDGEWRWSNETEIIEKLSKWNQQVGLNTIHPREYKQLH